MRDNINQESFVYNDIEFHFERFVSVGSSKFKYVIRFNKEIVQVPSHEEIINDIESGENKYFSYSIKSICYDETLNKVKEFSNDIAISILECNYSSLSEVQIALNRLKSIYFT